MNSKPNNNVQPIPKGYYTLTPYLSVKGAAQAIRFYIKAFGAKEIGRLTMPDGGVCAFVFINASIECALSWSLK